MSLPKWRHINTKPKTQIWKAVLGGNGLKSVTITFCSKVRWLAIRTRTRRIQPDLRDWDLRQFDSYRTKSGLYIVCNGE